MVSQNQTTHNSAAAGPALRAMYTALSKQFGPQHWWPARTRFEIMVGAILTQNTAWTNVEKAIANLRREKALTPRALHAAPTAALAQWIRPAGYYNVKARRLHSYTGWLMSAYGGSLNRMFKTPTAKLREELLSVNGVGKETADSILLYAGKRPIFVVDAYTRRSLKHLGWIRGDEEYDEIAALFMDHLPADEELFNEFHALIVQLGKWYCRPKKPRCEECPLHGLLNSNLQISNFKT